MAEQLLAVLSVPAALGIVVALVLFTRGEMSGRTNL